MKKDEFAALPWYRQRAPHGKRAAQAEGSETTNSERILMRLGTTNDYLLATKNLVKDISSKLDSMNAQLARL